MAHRPSSRERLMRDWITDPIDRGPFFVQAHAKEPWHVETDDNCEIMLCGKFISVDLASSKVQGSWGQRKCADCWMKLETTRKVRGLR